MKNSFTALDFETAHGKRWSICQVGLVRVENGVVAEELSILVQPPNNFYWNWFTNIHGIGPAQTATAQTFDIVWPQMESFIKNQEVVAHNGFSFDFPCLRQALEYYRLEIPEFTPHCTYKIYKDNLESLCLKHKIELNHHDALSDARACGELFKKHLENGK